MLWKAKMKDETKMERRNKERGSGKLKQHSVQKETGLGKQAQIGFKPLENGIIRWFCVINIKVQIFILIRYIINKGN